jgi:hypothetical protein
MSFSMKERGQNERRHLVAPPDPNEKPLGLGTERLIVCCPGNANNVLEKAKSVLRIINQYDGENWPDQDHWKNILPDWFVRNCGPDLSSEEAEAELARLSNLSPQEQLEEEKTAVWSLSNWLYYLEPENRRWYWWDGQVIDPEILIVAIEVYDWPFPWGSLDWLLRASGANKVETED